MRNTKIIQSPEERKNEVLKKYFKSISKFKVLTSEEERELSQKALDGDDAARERLIQSNLRLVISIAKKYQGYGISLMDLIQEGNNGLALSVSHYNPKRKTKFSTCASWWIKYAIKKAISDNSRIVKIPISQYNRYKKVSNFVNPIEQKTQRTPCIDEIKEELNLDKNQIELALSPSINTIPIISERENERPHELPLSPKDYSIEKEIEQHSLSELFDGILSKLTRREETVLRKIFGIGCEVKTLNEIAKEFDLSYERIRQIKKVALEKIKQRNPNLRKELYDD